METSRKKEVWTLIGVGMITVLVFGIIGLASSDPGAFGSVFGIFAAVLAIGWAALMACTYMLFYEWRTGRYSISAIAALTAAAAGLFSVSAIIGGLLLWAFMGSASQMISATTRERLVFRLRPTILPGLRVLLVGMLVFVVALLLPLVREQINRGEIFIPTDSLEIALRPASPLLGNFIEGYTANSTIDELIDFQLRKQQQELPPGAVLPLDQKAQVRRELSRSIGIELAGTETVTDVLAIYGNNYLRGLTDEGGLTVTIILVVVGLLAIRALVPFFAWIGLLIAFALFFFLRQSGLVRLQHTQLPVDRLKF